MKDAPNRYVIAYDVVCDRRRARLHDYLRAFGVRAQYSVFLVDLRAARVSRLKTKIAGLIDPAQDSVLFCRVGPSSALHPRAFEYLGKDRPEPPTGPIVL